MEHELNKFDKLRVNPDNFEKIKNLHENLYYGAVKALLGQDFTKHPHMLSRILIPLAQMRLQKYGGNILRRRVKRSRNEEKTEKMIGIEEMKKIREEIQKQRETDPKENFKVRTANNVDPLSNGKENNLAAKISSLLVKSLGPKSKNADIKWAKTYKTLQRLSEQIERGKNFPGSNLYEKRMYDIVLDRKNPSLSPMERRSPLGLLQQGMKLIDLLPGNKNNKKNGNETNNIRLFSPRFMPLAPDKGGPANPKSLLSPTLFAMYDEKDNHSFANMMRKAGVPEKYRQSIIGTLMELTGTTDHLEKAFNLLKKVDFFDEGVGHPIMKATDKLLNNFFNLEDSLDKRQRLEFKERGFTFGKKSQLLKIYRDEGQQKLLPDSELDRFDRYEKMSESEKELALWETIRELAEGRAISLVNASKIPEYHQQQHQRTKRFSTTLTF
uniref:Uncharacterized protein n=1 Tax=Meloidogyne javanica TaxID=6303 RepID=A0A915MJR5_MELJA